MYLNTLHKIIKGTHVQNLIDALVQELQPTPQKGIMSMPRHCQECANDKGGHTSYR